MKALMIFIDMFRTNILNMYDENAKRTIIDERFEKWGGTLYTKCYTPAPDTPRSNGCLWSSLYPKQNGCTTRLKYPKFYLKNPQNSLLSLLCQNECFFNIYMHKTTEQIGELPELYPNANYSNGKLLNEYLNDITIPDNSLTYISLEDYHAALYDYRANWDAVKKGNEKIDGALELIEQKLGLDTFDIIIIFSDHGFKFDKDKRNMTIREQLDDDRTKIFMYTRLKGQDILQKNNKLCCIMDIFPTLCDGFGININFPIEGISLLDSREHDYILLEDHKEFTVSLGQTIEYWGVVDQHGLSTIDVHENWLSEIKDQEVLDKYKKLISDKCSFYEENITMSKIHKYYDECLEYCPFFYDGELRKVKHNIRHSIKSFITKYVLKILRV